MSKAMVYHAHLSSPIGTMHVLASDEGLLVVDFIDRRDIDFALNQCAARLETTDGRLVRESDNHPHIAAIREQLEEYFSGERTTFDVPLIVQGTPFQRQAWAYLRTIPFAQTRTYGQQARSIGDVRAVRAVGGANGRNFLAIVIPCHRVIAQSGDMQGYGGGIERKRWLLNHEQSYSASGTFESIARCEKEDKHAPNLTVHV